MEFSYDVPSFICIPFVFLSINISFNGQNDVIKSTIRLYSKKVDHIISIRIIKLKYYLVKKRTILIFVMISVCKQFIMVRFRKSKN